MTVNVVAPGLIESPVYEQAFTPEQVEAMVPMSESDARGSGRPRGVPGL